MDPTFTESQDLEETGNIKLFVNFASNCFAASLLGISREKEMQWAPGNEACSLLLYSAVRSGFGAK